MFTVTVTLPLEKLAAMRDNFENLAKTNGPLDAVGQYVSGIGMPGYFRSGGGGWPSVRRGGTPLIDTTALVSGFGFSFGTDQKSIIIENDGRPKMIQAVQHFGATIEAKNAKYLKFKIGNQWVMKKSVTIPARPFWLWFNELRDNAVKIATERLLENLRQVMA